MTDHDDSKRRSPRSPVEGVRIIGAEEAQAAIDAGQVAGRRPDDAPRFGDRPDPPEGPRPPLRFPMGEERDPAEVRRPPVVSAAAGGSAGGAAGGSTGGRDDEPRTAPHDLPHWSEPPSGDNPRILPEEGDEDDLGAWSTFASSGPRWRDQPADWEEADFEDASVLADEEPRLGALDPETGPSDLFTFDEPEPEPMRINTRGTPDVAPPSGTVGPGRRDVTTAIVTGVGVGVVFLIALAAGKAPTLVLVTAVLVVAAMELFGALRQRGYQPGTLLGLVGTASILGAAYWRGEAALPLVLALFIVFNLFWYLFGVVRASPTVNAGATLFAFLYIGFLGSFAALLLKFPNGTGMLLGAVIATVAVDVGAFFIGSRMGRSLMAPEISPNKTWEGYLGGATLSVLASIIVVRAITPWDGGSAALLGALVGFVVAPLGDLCESLIKRDLDVKDMGSVLPGHGGVLDRIDGMLFTIPATFYLVKVLDLT